MSAAGMTATVLATGLLEAMQKDEHVQGDRVPLKLNEAVMDWVRNVAESYAAERPPIDMVLYCPSCGMQHIDMPEVKAVMSSDGPRDEMDDEVVWTNPPHKSHLCRKESGGCGMIWRPADVPTNGVAAITTSGKADTWLPDPEDAGRVAPARVPATLALPSVEVMKYAEQAVRAAKPPDNDAYSQALVALDSLATEAHPAGDAWVDDHVATVKRALRWVPPAQPPDLISLTQDGYALVVRAEAAGYVVSIEQVPKLPLAMGSYSTVVRVREQRPS